MKIFPLVFFFLLLGLSPVGAIEKGDPPTESPTQVLDNPFFDLFQLSDAFTEGSSFLSFDFQALSTRGKRPDKDGMILPPIGLHFEKRLLSNVGLRVSVSTNWWKEDKALLIAGSETFNEPFRYRYWVAGLGGTWHFTVNSDWDPYVGLMVNFRMAGASCDCQSETKSTFSGDLLAGTRYFLGDQLFASVEAGRDGVGYFKLGVGLRFD